MCDAFVVAFVDFVDTYVTRFAERLWCICCRYCPESVLDVVEFVDDVLLEVCFKLLRVVYILYLCLKLTFVLLGLTLRRCGIWGLNDKAFSKTTAPEPSPGAIVTSPSCDAAQEKTDSSGAPSQGEPQLSSAPSEANERTKAELQCAKSSDELLRKRTARNRRSASHVEAL